MDAAREPSSEPPTWRAPDLHDTVAMVTGASRGVGRGVALGLGEAGATIYLTGRTVEEGKGAVPLPGTIHQTAADVDRLGGHGIAVRCDHRHDEAVRQLFARVGRDQGRLDVLVNNVWGGYEFYNDGTPFWTERGFWTVPISRWDAMFQAGVRAHYVASVLAVPLMIERGAGLIVRVSSFASGAVDAGVAYSPAKAATDRLAVCMAHELREHGIAVISLHPGLVRTEAVLKAAAHFDLSSSQSPQFLGRVVASLAADPDVMRKTGNILTADELAAEYEIVDVDGRRPTEQLG